jgi:hypothetical protein
MVITVDYEDWSIFRDATIARIAVLLVDLASTYNLAKLKKKETWWCERPKAKVKSDKKHPERAAVLG